MRSTTKRVGKLGKICNFKPGAHILCSGAMEKITEFIKDHFYFPLLDEWGAPVIAVSFILLFLAETYRRLRKLKADRKQRLKNNIGLAFTALPVLRLALIPAMVLFARWAETKGIGLLNWLELPVFLSWILGFLLLDYGNYLWHLLNHKIPLLWRFHNVHHIDLDLDVTTALRFHFGEVLFSVLFRGAMIVFIGPPYLLVLFYEIIFQTATLFHHSNWKLPYRLEKAVSYIIVTPRMHGIHHSIVQNETNSNYSIVFNIWDRLHKSLRLNIPQQEINIGVPSYRDLKEQSIKNLLLMPFREPRPWKLPNGIVPEREQKEDKEELRK